MEKLTINGHTYYLVPGSKIRVISSQGGGLSQLKTMAKNAGASAAVSGANFFQMSRGKADPYGTIYGDLSAPSTGGWNLVANQTTTLYFNLTTGEYGGCHGYYFDNTQDVFSPSVIYPKTGGVLVADMVGSSILKRPSRYAFYFHSALVSGIGISASANLTPSVIHSDIVSKYGDADVAFLDGGGSAQFVCGETSIISGRAIPSAVAVFDEPAAASVSNGLVGTSLPHKVYPVDTHSKGRGGETVSAIVIHHQAGNLNGSQIQRVFASRRSSATYSIYSDGTISQHVSETDRPWTTSGANPDNHCITIEVANSSFNPKWEISEPAMRSLITLCADICRRYGIDKFYYDGKKGTLLRHCDYAATACPGPYIKEKTGYITDEVNKLLQKHEETPDTGEAKKTLYRVQCGVFSSKDAAQGLADRISAAGFETAVVEVK